MAKQRFEVIGVVFLFGILSLIATYPLILHFDTGVLYDSISGVKAWNRSGDQLQLLYWFWLVKENILGTVPFDSNPFEFNMAIPHETTGFATAPLALLFFLFSPLGDIAAYNCTIITTYVLAGTFMYLLVKLYSDSRMGALLGAIIFTFAPSRINGVTGGNMYGMLFFLYPWILYFLEKGINTKKIRYGVLSGLGMICLSMLEAHLLYYICIFLAAYLPLRVVMLASDDPYAAKIPFFTPFGFNRWSIIRYLLLIWGGGVVATLYSQILFTFRDQATFITSISGWIFLTYPLIPVVISFFLASLYRYLFQIDIGSAIKIVAKSLLPIYFLLPFGIAVMYGHAIDTATLVVSLGLSIFILKLFFLREYLTTFISLLTRGIVGQRASIIPIFPVLLAIGYIVIWLPMSKESKFESTIASAGRTLQDVRLYSAKLVDVITPESNVYIGIVTFLIILIVLISIFYTTLRQGDKYFTEGRESVFSSFYLCVACLGLLLSLGLALGKSSLYLLLYYYLPYFNYPRVSDRIIILTLFAVAVLAGYVVKKIQQRSTRPWLFFINLILLAVIVGQLKDFNFFRPTGVNILDKGQDIYTHVRENIGNKVLLEIPLWPGDSHQSSLYQHYIMHDRVPRVNGYSPLVRNDYLNTVFKPLAGMNKGRIGEKQWEILLELGVKYITVHNNRDIFLKKVSPFGPITTVRRFKSSPYLEFIDLDNSMHFKDFSKKSNKLYLFRVKNVEEVNATDPEKDSWYAMPFYYFAGNRLHKQTGEVVKDKLTERKVFRAVAGKHKPGFLVYGPYAYYTPGNYRCYFEVQIGKPKDIDNSDSPEKSALSAGDSTENPARIEVVQVRADDTLTVLAQRDIAEAHTEESWRREYLDFTLREFSRLEFRVYYYGNNDVLLEDILVYPQMHDKPRYFLAAEKMVGSTGKVVNAESSSTGKVVEAVIRRDKKGLLVYGPNSIYPKGKYRARVFLKLKNKAKLVKTSASAIFSVTHGIRKDIIAKREIYPAELNEENFSAIELDFAISHDLDLGFPVKFTGKANIQLDRIEIEKLID